MDGHVLEAEFPEGSGGHSRGLGAGSVKPDHGSSLQLREALACPPGSTAPGRRRRPQLTGIWRPDGLAPRAEVELRRSRGARAQSPSFPGPRPDLPVSARAWNRVGAHEMLTCWVRERGSSVGRVLLRQPPTPPPLSAGRPAPAEEGACGVGVPPLKLRTRGRSSLAAPGPRGLHVRAAALPAGQVGDRRGAPFPKEAGGLGPPLALPGRPPCGDRPFRGARPHAGLADPLPRLSPPCAAAGVLGFGAEIYFVPSLLVL